jgi:hypothetical protein
MNEWSWGVYLEERSEKEGHEKHGIYPLSNRLDFFFEALSFQRLHLNQQLTHNCC